MYRSPRKAVDVAPVSGNQPGADAGDVALAPPRQRMRRFRLLVTLLALAPPAHAQVADSSAAADGITASARAFSRALERGDAAGMTDQYVDDATLITPTGRLFTGREAILAFWTPRNPDFRTLEHSLTTDRLVVTGDVAMEVGTWRQKGQLRQEEPTESAGRYLVVWRRLPNGSWKMQFDSWTAPFPAD